MDHMHPVSGPTSRKIHYPIKYVAVRNKKQRNSTPKLEYYVFCIFFFFHLEKLYSFENSL